MVQLLLDKLSRNTVYTRPLMLPNVLLQNCFYSKIDGRIQISAYCSHQKMERITDDRVTQPLITDAPLKLTCCSHPSVHVASVWNVRRSSWNLLAKSNDLRLHCLWNCIDLDAAHADQTSASSQCMFGTQDVFRYLQWYLSASLTVTGGCAHKVASLKAPTRYTNHNVQWGWGRRLLSKLWAANAAAGNYLHSAIFAFCSKSWNEFHAQWFIQCNLV
jgi:hypothetical protein